MVMPPWLAPLALGVVIGALPVRWHYETRIAKDAETNAQAAKTESENARKREQALQAQIDAVRDEAQKDEERIKADAFNAGVASVGLRGAAKQTAARCPAIDPSRGAPAEAPGDLLADVLARLDEATGEIARAADERYDAGKRCEQTLEALKNPSK